MVGCCLWDLVSLAAAEGRDRWSTTSTMRRPKSIRCYRLTRGRREAGSWFLVSAALYITDRDNRSRTGGEVSTEQFSKTNVLACLEPNSTTRTPATNTGHGHHQRTSSQQFYNQFATSQCQSPTSRHVKTLGCGKFLSVGGARWWCS